MIVANVRFDHISTVAQCDKHGSYHRCSCGMGVLIGSGMGDHWLARHIEKAPVVTLPSWEARDGAYPTCFHIR